MLIFILKKQTMKKEPYLSNNVYLLMSFFFFYIVLQVSPSDGLPPIVCNMCRTQLDTCQQFRDKAQRSQQKLQNFLKFANKLTGDPQVSERTYQPSDFSCELCDNSSARIKEPEREVYCVGNDCYHHHTHMCKTYHLAHIIKV